MMHKGKSIRMYLVDGVPTGLITAEIMNWTGHVLMIPNGRFIDGIKRREAAKTGVYILVGIDPDNADRQIVYIGESDNVGKRLVQHNKDEKKDWWEQAIFVTSKDQNLTKAHARYLESRLIQMADEAGRVKVANGTAPTTCDLPEADISDMEFFLSQVAIVLPVLGAGFLKPKLRISSQTKEIPIVKGDLEVRFEAKSTKLGVDATMVMVDGQYVVLKGSKARAKWQGAKGRFVSYDKLYAKLVADGVLSEPDGKSRIFTEDAAFNSPSAAAAVLFGRSANGRTTWKVSGTKTTYADWEEKFVEAVNAYISEDNEEKNEIV